MARTTGPDSRKTEEGPILTLKGQAADASEINEKLAALFTNASAVRAIASAVEGAIGPKGLDISWSTGSARLS